MSDDDPDPPIRIALGRADDDLLARLSEILAGVAGLELVGEGEAADLMLLSTREAAGGAGPDAALTPREMEVLALLAEGAANKTIALRLGISVHTAKFHVRSLIDKLDAVGRTDVVAHAARLGIIQL